MPEAIQEVAAVLQNKHPKAYAELRSLLGEILQGVEMQEEVIMHLALRHARTITLAAAPYPKPDLSDA